MTVRTRAHKEDCQALKTELDSLKAEFARKVRTADEECRETFVAVAGRVQVGKGDRICFVGLDRFRLQLVI